MQLSFRVGRCTPLLGELEQRARSYPGGPSSLLAECHAAYSSSGKALLLQEIRGLDATRGEFVELCATTPQTGLFVAMDDFADYSGPRKIASLAMVAFDILTLERAETLALGD
ncbi:hypothetical protein FA15DRAFT_676522 [Coprinopsis marcescibilis]|uniref:Uncharacterized protein n=1 Tax=Coprinopsis marcescibilis TaxID=230819 RepID=A0A5C3K9S3_COPMA|nr:hypothetical protein FA15DRAFT_676522 [Coprinopsis marcescibilis]